MTPEYQQANRDLVYFAPFEVQSFVFFDEIFYKVQHKTPLKRIRSVLSALIFVLSSSGMAQAQSSEVNIYSFQTAEGDSIQLVMSNDTSRMALKIHPNGKPAEVVQEIRNQSFKKFSYSYYLRPGASDNSGLDLNSVTFEDGDIVYVLSSDSEGGKSFEPGLVIKNKRTGAGVTIDGESKTIKGTLLDFRDNEILPITNN